jgi:tight adherence protein B
MDMLARAVTAGYAFTSGLELIAKEMSDPLAHEFRVTYEQQNLGLPLREALGNLAVRMPLPDVKILVALLQIQQESGGNLAEMLNNLSAVVRERFKLLRQVRVYTAEGRLSMFILTALPPIAALLFLFINPDYVMPLFTEPVGHRMLAAAAVMQVAGYLVIKKIVHLKV